LRLFHSYKASNNLSLPFIISRKIAPSLPYEIQVKCKSTLRFFDKQWKDKKLVSKILEKLHLGETFEQML
jgi:hypothetical protein